MPKLKKNFTKISLLGLSDSVVSMILGMLVVLLVALLAYNYFKTQTPAAVSDFPPTGGDISQNNGEITNPFATVALPTQHFVVAGESLWTIAEKYYGSGYNYVDLAKINNLKNADTLEVGQKLTIPNVELKEPTVPQALIRTVTPSQISGNSYTVLYGDSLWTIALRAYGDAYRWPDVAQANKLVNPNIIHAGNVLSIPR